jgi:hypothetical protein
VFLASGVGPTDSDLFTMSSYRTELNGLIALLYILYYQNVYEQMNLGITPFLATDHDLVEVAQHLLEVIPLAVADGQREANID